MMYRVVLQRLAVADLQEAYEWAARRAPRTAERWLRRFEEALQTLDRNPQLERAQPRPVRQLGQLPSPTKKTS
ncbi:MAG TPA: type II toxin-antitoxin system RelE/ParE family toxin [Planctomycetaceae bacterium]|nr:type II toxin-antitoxin system RelE/ParE family toxin [Planctomycetaceae bacterium]